MSRDVQGKLVIISGPSGVGKSTIVGEVLRSFPGRMRLSISATTRPPRPNERDGVDYHFLSTDEFARRREAGEFIECVEVFGQGYWYGTLSSEVRPSLETGLWVILEVDVAGAEKVLGPFPEAITLFLRPDTLEELERRLRSRGTETPEAIQRRLRVARDEMDLAGRYQYQVINDTIPHAVEQVCGILRDRGLQND